MVSVMRWRSSCRSGASPCWVWSANTSDSVVDSDEEGHTRGAMFSDDEDSDAEERLTAANRYPLSLH
jgi:hypothetical protein